MKLSSSFQHEKFKRDIDNCEDVKKLKELTKELLNAYYSTKTIAETLLLEKINIEGLEVPPPLPKK